MRIFGSERLQGLVEKAGFQDTDAIESKMVSNAIERAQKKVEGNNFDIRKTLLGYDDVMNQQREVIYQQRSEVLEGKDIKEQIEEMMETVLNNAVDSHISGLEEEFKSDLEKLINYVEDLCIPQGILKVSELENMSNDEIKEKIVSVAKDIYAKKEEEIGSDSLREIERVILLE